MERALIGEFTIVLAALTMFAIEGCRAPQAKDAPMTHGHNTPKEAPHGHSAGNTQDYIARMEDPKRDVWQKPQQVIRTLKLNAGERVADLGCGPGYFTIPLAKSVGATGKVWAVDIEQAMLDRTAHHAKGSGLANVEYVLCKEDDPLLPAGQVDTIFIVNTYHHFPNRLEYLHKLRTALAPGGRIVNIDFVPKDRELRGFGPPLEMQLARETVDHEMESAGFKVAAAQDFLPEQYFVEYRLAERVGSPE